MSDTVRNHLSVSRFEPVLIVSDNMVASSRRFLHFILFMPYQQYRAYENTGRYHADNGIPVGQCNIGSWLLAPLLLWWMTRMSEPCLLNVEVVYWHTDEQQAWLRHANAPPTNTLPIVVVSNAMTHCSEERALFNHVNPIIARYQITFYTDVPQIWLRYCQRFGQVKDISWYCARLQPMILL